MSSNHSFLAENRNCASSPSARNRLIAPHILSRGTPLNSSDIVLPFLCLGGLDEPWLRSSGRVTGEVAGQMFGEVFAAGGRPVKKAGPPPAKERAAEEVDARRVDAPPVVAYPPAGIEHRQIQ